jgi:geranylgeranyl pyrophosphate synthase
LIKEYHKKALEALQEVHVSEEKLATLRAVADKLLVRKH